MMSKYEILAELIQKFKQCEDLQDKGILLNTCYKSLNKELEENKENGNGMDRKLFQLKADLSKAHKEYLNQVEFFCFIQDTRQLQEIRKSNKTGHVEKLVAELRKVSSKLQKQQLSGKERKQFDDAVKLIEMPNDCNQTMVSEQIQLIQEVQTIDDEEEQLYEIVHETSKLNQLQTQICHEINRQQQNLQGVVSNQELAQFNMDKAEDEYIEAHSQEMQRRRNVIRAYFTAIFGFLSYFKGFGAAIGGAIGYMSGNFMAKVSQHGLEEKVSKNKQIDDNNK